MCHLKNKKGLPLNPCRLFLICEGSLQIEKPYYNCEIMKVKVQWKIYSRDTSIQGTQNLVLEKCSHNLCIRYTVPLLLKKGSYPFLNKKFKDFSRTFKDTFPIFQGFHSVQKRALSLFFTWFIQNFWGKNQGLFKD